MEDMYHCCRWCKHYKNGNCHKGAVTVTSDNDVYAVSESGKLSELLEEILNSVKPTEFLQEAETILRSYRVSGELVEELKRLWEEMIPEFLDFKVKQELDERISVLYQSELAEVDCSDEVEIKEPENFYCKYWE